MAVSLCTVVAVNFSDFSLKTTVCQVSFSFKTGTNHWKFHMEIQGIVRSLYDFVVGCTVPESCASSFCLQQVAHAGLKSLKGISY